MLNELLPLLACPWCGGHPLEIVPTAGPAGATTVLLGCTTCQRTSEVRDGIWHAMGDRRAARTPAQLSNVVPPTPQLYEKVWRVRSLSLISRRPFPNDEELGEMVAALSPGPGRVMLDVACSEGLYARALARAGSPVIAIDHSLPFLERVRDRCRAEGLDVLPVRALAQHLPIIADGVQGVAIGGSLNEIGDQQAAIDEAGRVLNGSGRLFSMHLLRAHTFWGRALQRVLGPSGIHFPTLPDTHHLLSHAGLAATEVRTDGVVCRVTAARP